jgi:hypothetical protein
MYPANHAVLGRFGKETRARLVAQHSPDASRHLLRGGRIAELATEFGDARRILL